MKKSKKLESIVTSGVLLIPTVLVLSSAMKSNAMLGAIANKFRPILKAPAVATRLPQLNNIAQAIKKPQQATIPMMNTPTASTGSRNNSTLSPRTQLNNFKTGIYGTTTNIVSAKKRPPYNPNKGPAPKPPTSPSIYEQPDPLYQNINGNPSLAKRPLPNLPLGAKNFGTTHKVLIKNGQIIQN